MKRLLIKRLDIKLRPAKGIRLEAIEYSSDYNQILNANKRSLIKIGFEKQEI